MGTEREAFEDAMRCLSADELRAASKYLDDVLRGYKPPWWSECVVQRGATGGRRPDLWDAVVMMRMDVDLALGVLAVARVEIGDVPHADKDERANEELLKRALPSTWSVSVGGYDDDGGVYWPDSDRPDFVDLMTMRRPTFRSWAPLEIGSTGAHKTSLHLAQKGSLARWPYGSTYLWIFESRHHHPSTPLPEWDELLARRREHPTSQPPTYLVGLHFDCGRNIEDDRPPLPTEKTRTTIMAEDPSKNDVPSRADILHRNVEVWSTGPQEWSARVSSDGKTTHADSRDGALFYAGWWHGRRELGQAIAKLVDGGERATIVDSEDEGLEGCSDQDREQQAIGIEMAVAVMDRIGASELAIDMGLDSLRDLAEKVRRGDA